jgi:uncharacterized membrane protein
MGKMEIKKGKISILLSIIVAFSFVGIITSAMLLDVYNNNALGKQSNYCKEDSGCDNFDESGFSKIWRIPISGIMLGFYMIFLAIILLKKFWKKYYKITLIAFSLLGIIISAVMFYILQFEIKQYCNYCTYLIIINLFIALFTAIYCKREIRKVTN